jgi:transposase
MLSLPPTARIWVCTAPADMRKSFDGLCGLIRAGLGGDRVKILTFEGDGLAIYYKRLEAGTFHWPTSAAGKVALRTADLLMLLDGVEWERVQRRTRYQRPPLP